MGADAFLRCCLVDGLAGRVGEVWLPVLGRAVRVRPVFDQRALRRGRRQTGASSLGMGLAFWHDTCRSRGARLGPVIPYFGAQFVNLAGLLSV